MFGLAQKVGGADFAVDTVVGDDQRFGRARQQIDADAAEQLPLGFRHIGVAGPDDHVDRLDRFGAERHGRDGLHAAQHINLVGAAEMHGGDDGGVRPALERRGTGDDALHARHLGGDDGHMRRGDHRIAPARHVAADRIHRDVAMAEHDAGQRLDLQVVHGLLLFLREIAYLRLRELDVIAIALGHFRDGLLDVLRAEPEILRRPLVEFLRQFADGGVLARVDLRQDAFDRFAHLGVGGLDRACVHSALEPTGHRVLQPSFLAVLAAPMRMVLYALLCIGSVTTAVP